MPYLLQCPDYGEPNTIQQDGRAHCRASWEKRAADFVADHDHRALLDIVQLIDPAPLVQWQIANMAEIRGHAHDLSTGLVEITDGANVAPRNGRRGGPNARALRRNVLKIAISQVVLPQGRKTAVHHGSASRPDEHYVFADGIELLAVSGPESLPQTNKQQQGSHAPCDPKHREE